MCVCVFVCVCAREKEEYTCVCLCVLSRCIRGHTPPTFMSNGRNVLEGIAELLNLNTTHPKSTTALTIRRATSQIGNGRRGEERKRKPFCVGDNRWVEDGAVDDVHV